ncbi:MAG: (4Fe-4S)-binding protein [Bacteroidales bacterium]|nr:(4Fe-4S)-binding protein [Bacteroidales bacterium]
MNNKEIIKKYDNGEVTVVWKPSLCIHSTLCFTGLPQVFDPGNRPWVNAQGATTQKIIDQVKRCPSGALSYILPNQSEPINTEELMGKPKIAAKEPKAIELEEGKNYAWCICGLSTNQPFCDGSHKTTNMKPKIFKTEQTGTHYLCQCKHTKNSPYCDGSHNDL